LKRALISVVVALAAVAFVVVATGAKKGSAAGTYKVQLDNAFGLVSGADFKVAGVPAGTIKDISLDQKTLRAVVTVQVKSAGFGQFHTDATCDSRPESLIGEYFIDCNPGSSGPVLKPGGTIPVSHTQSTIPADLVQDVMRMPYRQRFTLIVNELGAAAAARSGDLQAALRRAVPALSETDNLLALLGNDSTTLQNLTRDSNSVITALANNSAQVNRFIVEAGRTASATATQQQNLRGTIHRLPGLLEQLRPTLKQLGTTVNTNQPVLDNLHAAAGQINRLFTDLPAFSRSARPAIRALGRAGVTGRAAVTAATPTVKDLNAFAKPTPELAGNLAIVLHDLDDPSRAVERDPRSPGGNGFTGLQALLGYVFNQALAINTFGPEGHVLAVDAFASSMCSAYATPASIALAIKQYGAQFRQCYSWLGPNQPGVNETDPSAPTAAVPDPGGEPPGQGSISTAASRLTAADVQAGLSHRGAKASSTKSSGSGTPGTTTGTSTTPGAGPTSSTAPTTAAGTTTSTSTTSSGGTAGAPSPTTPPINLGNTINQLLGGLTAARHNTGPKKSAGGSAPAAAGSGSGSGSGSTGPGQATELLNYLLAP
jgi:phospholipid/cholesterol/gamma-HCH transport system substrate-binding protein